MDSSQLTRHKKDRYTANALNGATSHPIYPLDEEKRIGYKHGSKIVTYNKRTVLPGCTGPTCNEDLIPQAQSQSTFVFDTISTVLQTSNNILYIAVDSNNNIFWVERIGILIASGNKIRKRDSTNIITDVYTFTSIGLSPEASQVVLDNNDNLYFFDFNVGTSSFCLTKITPGGFVSQFTNTIIGQSVTGVTLNKENGDIYCVVPSTCQIYKTNISGTTPVLIAGSTAGYLDSLNPLTARFNVPTGITFDKQNNYLYITELVNDDIRKIDLNTGIVSTYSSTAGSTSPTTGPSAGNVFDVDHTSSKFMNPRDIEIDSNGNLYICDLSNNQIKKIDSSGFVTLFAGSGAFGITNGPPLISATFSLPFSMFIRSPTEMYVADSTNYAIRKFTGSYQ